MSNSTKLANLQAYLATQAPMILDTFERLFPKDSAYFGEETERLVWANGPEGTKMIRALETAAEALGLNLKRIHAAEEPEPLAAPGARVRPSALAERPIV